jgi:phosphoserine phosphatase
MTSAGPSGASVIAVLFDFDHTLGRDSTSAFLAAHGVDVRRFWSDVEARVAEGWDPVPAYLGRMIEASREGRPITREALRAFGKKVELYPGVAGLWRALRAQARSLSRDLRIEFYLVSSGIGEILRQTRIAREFTDLWANEFSFDARGAIAFPRNVVSFTDKTRYVFQVQKGIFGPASRSKPFEVNRKVPAEALRVPLDQMIFVGDGYTDVPCFSLIRKSGGVALGVFDPKDRRKWGHAWGFVEDGRVSNLAPADYRPGSALRASLEMAIEAIAWKIEVRRRSYQG